MAGRPLTQDEDSDISKIKQAQAILRLAQEAVRQIGPINFRDTRYVVPIDAVGFLHDHIEELKATIDAIRENSAQTEPELEAIRYQQDGVWR